MRIIRMMGVLAALAVLVGCATTRPAMDRDEFIATTQHTYDGVTEKQFYQAAEKLFRLSDASDTKYAYPNEHTMFVQHWWTVYMVLAFAQGTHNWRITSEPTDNGVKGSVYVSMNSTGVYGTPTGGGGASTTTLPQNSNIVDTPALYQLFWARMDYLLGKSDKWPTCDDWSAREDQGKTYGILEPLCLFANMDDTDPSAPGN